MEGSDVSDELDANVGADPNAGAALLRASGLSDLSAEGMARVDVELDRSESFQRVHWRGLVRYVMDAFCTYSPDDRDWERIAMSVMETVASGEISLCGVGRGYRNEVRYLANVYERLLASVGSDGTVTVPRVRPRR